MYVGFYRLTGRPFQLSPDPRFYFDSQPHKKAMAYLTYGLNQGEGFIVVTGHIGAGKTTLVGHLFDQLSEDVIAAKVVTTQLEADDMLRAVADAFGIHRDVSDKATLLTRIEEFLVHQHRRGKRLLLVVDEAQNVPLRSLEELRMLSNFQADHRPILQIFLLGQPQFRSILAHPDMEQLRQRVIASYHLGPLSAEDTRAYVEHRLRLVDWRNDPTFSEDAFQLIHEHSHGVPRKINTLCARLLLFAYLEQRHDIDGGMVEAVIRDLAEEGAAPVAAVPEPAPAPAPASTVADGPVAVPPAVLRDLAGRIERLETQVAWHERTIRGAIEIIARHLGHARSKLNGAHDPEGTVHHDHAD